MAKRYRHAQKSKGSRVNWPVAVQAQSLGALQRMQFQGDDPPFRRAGHGARLF